MTLNAAEVVEHAALALQKPMNEVIDRGDSAVQQFYCGATVFVTGGSGFLGKQLIEKLFRAFKINKVYVLLRKKKGKPIQERLEFMLKDPVYNWLREKQSDFADRIVAVEGDVADIRLGINDQNWSSITKEVDTIFHAAATVRFDEPLRVATLINVRGTREVLALAKACPKLKSYVHVSTAFSHATSDRIGKEIKEQFYQVPVPPHVMIQLAEEMDEGRLNSITPELTKGWPNTYTFTKAIAEEVVKTDAGDLPVAVVRPPVLTCSYYEPSPGWMDMSCVYAASGLILGVGLGVLHVVNVNKYVKLNSEPLDLVNNAVIASGWDTTVRRAAGDNDIKVYNIANSGHRITFDDIAQVMRKDCIKFASPKAVWYCGLIEINNRFLYNIVSLLLQNIPALVIDRLCSALDVKMDGAVVSLSKIYKKIDKLVQSHKYFLSNEFDFKDDNVKSLMGKMSDADRAIFNCDITSVDSKEFIKVWVLGVRKFILKDKFDDVERGCRRQLYFGVANYLLLSIYFYILWCIFSYCWYILKNMCGI